MTSSPWIGRLTEADCDLDDFAALVDQRTDATAYPHADRVVDDVLVFDAKSVRDAIAAEGSDAVEAELVSALTDGPGVVVLENAFADTAVVDRVTAAFDAMIADERAHGGPAGDHFAAPGSNDRVWNALEKLAVRDPEAFVDYYANQVTSQVNVVRPGGQRQDPHRDYHLGFLSNEVAAQFPTHVHLLSPVLTLQGAVAHSDMPVESGPTMYLPYSHQYAPGYLAWRLPQFRDLFLERHVQLPLRKGDAAFFNPALFHGAGTNRSADVQRCANLLQVSSAFGRAMEHVDRSKTSKAVYPALATLHAKGDAAAVVNAVTAAADGYPFPTNLDRDQPIGGLTPIAQTDVLLTALEEGWDAARVVEELDAYDRRRDNEEIR